MPLEPKKEMYMPKREASHQESFAENLDFQGEGKRHLDCLEKVTDDVKKQCAESAKGVRLAHYTDISTILSLLRERGGGEQKEIVPESGLRLYDVHTMNDPHEGNIVRDFISCLPESVRFAAMYGERLSDRRFNRLPEELRSREREDYFGSDVYIVSFTGNAEADGDKNKYEIGDNLLHWRLYGRDGIGCSIQFSPRNTRGLCKVLYGNDALFGKIQNCIKSCVCFAWGMFEKGKQQFAGDFARNVAFRLKKIAFMCKDQSYLPEKEYRFVIPAVGDKPCKTSEVRYDFQRRPNECVKKYVYAPDIVGREIIFSRGSKVFVGPRARCKENVCEYLEHEAKKKGIMSQSARFSAQVQYRRGVMGFQANQI